MAYIHDLGSVGSTPQSAHMMVAYDDVYSINFLGEKLKAYWTTQHGRTSFAQRMRAFYQDYDNIVEACRNLDERIYNDGKESGGQQ